MPGGWRRRSREASLRVPAILPGCPPDGDLHPTRPAPAREPPLPSPAGAPWSDALAWTALGSASPSPMKPPLFGRLVHQGNGTKSHRCLGQRLSSSARTGQGTSGAAGPSIQAEPPCGTSAWANVTGTRSPGPDQAGPPPLGNDLGLVGRPCCSTALSLEPECPGPGRHHTCTRLQPRTPYTQAHACPHTHAHKHIHTCSYPGERGQAKGVLLGDRTLCRNAARPKSPASRRARQGRPPRLLTTLRHPLSRAGEGPHVAAQLGGPRLEPR